MSVWLDTQLLASTPIPSDIDKTGVVGEQTLLFDPIRAIDRRSGVDLNSNEALIRILKNSEIDISLRTIGNAFFPRVITLNTSPSLIIAPNRSPRGYIIINANTSASGITTTLTMFAAATVLPVATTSTAAVSVGGYETARFLLNVTEPSSGVLTSFNLETQETPKIQFSSVNNQPISNEVITQKTMDTQPVLNCTLSINTNAGAPASSVIISWTSENAVSAIINNDKVVHQRNVGKNSLYGWELNPVSGGEISLPLSDEKGELNTYKAVFVGVNGETKECSVTALTQ
jgi:hypothetical protein